MELIRNDKTYLIPDKFDQGVYCFDGDILKLAILDIETNVVKRIAIDPANEVELSDPIDWNKYIKQY